MSLILLFVGLCLLQQYSCQHVKFDLFSFPRFAWERTRWALCAQEVATLIGRRASRDLARPACPGATCLNQAIVCTNQVWARGATRFNQFTKAIVQPALARRARIGRQDERGAVCSDQPIEPISQVWARGLGQGYNAEHCNQYITDF